MNAVVHVAAVALGLVLSVASLAIGLVAAPFVLVAALWRRIGGQQ